VGVRDSWVENLDEGPRQLALRGPTALAGELDSRRSCCVVDHRNDPDVVPVVGFNPLPDRDMSRSVIGTSHLLGEHVWVGAEELFRAPLGGFGSRVPVDEFCGRKRDGHGLHLLEVGVDGGGEGFGPRSFQPSGYRLVVGSGFLAGEVEAVVMPFELAGADPLDFVDFRRSDTNQLATRPRESST